MKYNDVLSYGSSEGMCGSEIEVAGRDDAQWKQIVSFCGKHWPTKTRMIQWILCVCWSIEGLSRVFLKNTHEVCQGCGLK